MGLLVTETNRWYFPDANTIDKTSEVTLPDGTSMNFEFRGKRNRGILLKVGTQVTVSNYSEEPGDRTK
jgi:hypothetical protein